MPTETSCHFGHLLLKTTLSHLSAHVVNRLLRENRKTIPKFLSGKKTFQKYNPPDFKFYPSELTHTSRKLLRIKVTPDLHLTYRKKGGNLGLVLKMKNITCLSIVLTKHVKYTYLQLFKFVLYSIVAFKAN